VGFITIFLLVMISPEVFSHCWKMHHLSMAGLCCGQKFHCALFSNADDCKWISILRLKQIAIEQAIFSGKSMYRCIATWAIRGGHLKVLSCWHGHNVIYLDEMRTCEVMQRAT